MAVDKQDHLENDIILLHQLEKVIIDKIDSSKTYPKILYVWDICVSLLEDYKCFQNIGLKPALARGLIAEIMCKYVIKHWAKETGRDCRLFSNLLIPRVDGGTTQLDLLVISNDFALAIECKSLYGRMTIKDSVIKTTRNTLSPWKQNYGHIMSLKPILSEFDLYFHNLVYLFSFGSITEYEPKPEEKLIVNINSLNTLNSIATDNNFFHRKSLTSGQLDKIELILADYVPEVQQEVDHIEFINEFMSQVK